MEVSKASWFVYLVRCRDGSLYCGIAKDLDRRLVEHNSADKGAKYTRGRRPVQLVYREVSASRAEAVKREGQIKRMKRAEKMALTADAIYRPDSLPAQKCRNPPEKAGQ